MALTTAVPGHPPTVEAATARTTMGRPNRRPIYLLRRGELVACKFKRALIST
jgi:hypothetical protein